ncbi:MAG: glycosyltransferase family 4 protein [Candidatus Micrarchaeota archaeon]|nr:glycosyltransferase family 4 protein [Candidatus Micrarchaeota archaeon]
MEIDFRRLILLRVSYYVKRHPLISNDAGGAEMQLYLIGRGLAKRGWHASYLVDDVGQKEREEREGQALYRVDNFRDSRLHLAKSLHHLALNTFATYGHPSFERALSLSNPDVVHQRGSSLATGYMAHGAAGMKKPFVFSIAHINDCTLSGEYWKGLLRKTLKRRLYLYGVEKAEIVIATANYLKEAFLRTFPGKDVRTVPSGYPVPDAKRQKTKRGRTKTHESSSQKTAVWVGRFTADKFPEVFLRLAKAMPEYRFVMVGGVPSHSEYEITRREAAKLANVELTGAVSLAKVNELISESTLLVDTSREAGFPNTFIQAWLRSTPTVSLAVDPDGIIKREKLGFVSGSEKKLAEQVGSLLEDGKLARSLGRNAFKYARRNHDIENTARMHDEIYRELIE